MIVNRVVHLHRILFQSAFKMGMLTDKLQERQTRKAEQDFKKQIQLMSNKPSFTLLDYKQRVADELANIRSSMRKKMSTDAKEMEKKLEMEKKIMNCLYEEELLGEGRIGQDVKKEISLISELPLEEVKNSFKKAQSYKKMHRFLRHLNISKQPLPDSMNELQYKFRQSRFALSSKERRHMQRKQQKGKGYMRAFRLRYMKFKK